MKTHPTRIAFGRPTAKLGQLMGLAWAFLPTPPAFGAAAHFDDIWISEGLPGNIVKQFVQDHTGYLWIATADGLARYDGYRVHTVPLSDDGEAVVPDVRSMALTPSNELWVGTREHGLFRIRNQEPLRVPLQTEAGPLADAFISALWAVSDDRFWLTTRDALILIDDSGFRLAHYPLGDSGALGAESVLTLFSPDQEALWVGTHRGLLVLDLDTGTLKQGLTPVGEGGAVRAFHKDSQGTFWLGSDTGLYRLQPDGQWSRVEAIAEGQRVYALTSDESSIWVGTLYNGLHRLLNNGQVQRFAYQSGSDTALSDNVIYALLVDRSATLWVGTFNSGINRLDLGSLNFGLHDDGGNSVHCLPNRAVYGFLEDPDGSLWIASESGLVQFNPRRALCRPIARESSNPRSLSHQPIDMLRGDAESLWVATARGLNRLDTASGEVDRLDGEVPRTLTYFVARSADAGLLLGTREGLFEFKRSRGNARRIPGESAEVENAQFIAWDQDRSGQYWFATSAGLVTLSPEGLLHSVQQLDSPIHGITLDSIHLDSRQNIWAGVERRGLARISTDGHLVTLDPLGPEGEPVRVVSGILPDDEGDLWVSTNRGLYRLDPETGQRERFETRDGLQSDVFARGSAHRGVSGRLYFGGRRGFNAFWPADIQRNPVKPRVELTRFSWFNEWQTPGQQEGSPLTQPLSALAQLEITHRDTIFGLEFAALHFADPSRNRYAYMLQGFDPDWTVVAADNRHVTYTNLPAGEYRFRVRAASKDGVWGDDEAQLAIVVHPPPWLSPWAWALYALAIVLMTVLYARVRNRAALRRASELESEVALRVEEVRAQRDTIENLLAHKNQMFANVSHEFRTPLTLIIGPLEKLVRSPINPEMGRAHKLMLRNARRLLNLVDQLLTLARLDRDDEMPVSAQHVNPKLRFVVASFQSMADERNIELQTLESAQCYAQAGQDTVEILLGNLVSNALKYSTDGGTVTVGCQADRERVELSVRDCGAGLSAEECTTVFERFARLDRHSDRPGSGLGLALVRDLARALGGDATVESAVGSGSTFRVWLPRAMEGEAASSAPALTVVRSEESAAPTPQARTATGPGRGARLLIVEDNADMRDFMVEVLNDRYRCLVAGDGQEGVAVAMREIPDLIISDVMMPNMDGYQLSRVIRGDDRTCHIPLILLTARGDRDSRIQGWREQVDEYLTKPFDAEELRQRVRNLLNIRNILRSKNQQQLARGEDLDELNRRDRAFVQRLKAAIEANYGDPDFGREAMASALAVSERQLQRKLKALVDENPSNLLREHRLKSAAARLADGEQVAVVSDGCGFSSPSHFSQSFKSRYGLSPKQYQMQHSRKA